MQKTLASLALLLLLVTAQTFAGQFDKGVIAARKGDYRTAVRLWRPLANHGNVKAQYNLGLMYHKGLGVARNDKLAIKWWRMAAQHGDATAQTGLGNMYNFGLGAPRNLKLAAKWYQSAAKKGNEKAQYSIGFMYLKGIGKPRDYHKAMYWFRRAADQGDAYARFYMGFMYEQGQGVKVNPVVAFALYSLDTSQPHAGHNLASVYRDRLINILPVTEITHAKTLTQRLLRSKPMTKALDAYFAKGKSKRKSKRVH